MAQLISIGQILDQSWDHYTKHFKTLMKISLWYLLVIIFMTLGSALLPMTNPEFLMDQGVFNVKDIIGFIILIGGSLVVLPIIAVWVTLSLITAIDLQAKKRSVDLKEVSKKSWKNFFPYVWITILATLLILLPLLAIVPGVGLIVANLALDGGVWLGALSVFITFIGGVAALIFLIMLSIKLFFIDYELIVDGVHGSGAIKASFALVKGRFWKTFGRIFVPSLILTVATAVIQGLASAIISFSTLMSPLSSNASFYITLIFNNILTYGMIALITPLSLLFGYFLYESLKQNPVK